ncbi:leucine-rich repeat-containing 15 [Brachionus plicatilis]|uniref:Leucine-rich repeat-containing 15 n=1 Tax=Brachionus plicatilis TaxID=10195 RepID=A0A3M7QDT9_BRAPC|nr:leucine-rich repeat-containing 15 [Brachionus plicatilis]
MKFYFFYLQISLYFVSSYADPRCPFPSCSSSYSSRGCSIYCNSDQFPNITNPIPSNKIHHLSFTNLKYLPSKAFDSLFIDYLYIYANNLTTIELNAFENVQKLNYLTLDSISNMSIILTGQQVHIAKMVKRLRIRRCNIQDANVFQTMKDLSHFSNLNELNIHYNNFSNFEFNFTQSFPNLYNLDISDNFLENVHIESKSLTRLYLNRNRINKLNGKMLDNLTNLGELHLESNLVAQIESSITHHRLYRLYLSSNNLSKIPLSTFCGLKNLHQLRLSNNNLSEIPSSTFCGLKNLQELQLSNNNLSEIPSSTFCGLKNLRTLRLSNNNLGSINLSCLENVTSLYLSNVQLNGLIDEQKIGNLIRVNRLDLSNNYIQEIDFSNLPFINQNLASLTKLEYLGLGNNIIEVLKIFIFNQIELKKLEKIPFQNNTNLRNLNLGSNHLKTIADLSELAFLGHLDLSNNKISRLPNYAFERKISEANIFVTQISINLLNNPIETYSSKSLCSQFSYSFGFAGITLNIDDVNIMPKCMLKQLKSDRTVIYSIKRPSCEMLLMAKKENITLNGNLSPECDPSLSIDDCSSNSRFKCPKGEDFIRHTTWITGDPHVFSYKNNYELCSIGSDAICFQHGSFVLYCTDQKIGRANQIATVLTKIKFVYTLKNGANVTFEANHTSFPTTFDNGLDYINEYTDDVQNNKSVEMVVTTRGIVPYRILFIEQTKTHILISKWNSFYSILLRAKHETYTESFGYLYEGCQTTGDNQNFSLRKKRSTDQKRCSTLCSAIRLEVDDENMPQHVLEDACMYDCVQVNESFTQMVRASAQLFDLSIQNDSTISEAIFELNEPLVEVDENFEIETIRSSKAMKQVVSYFIMTKILLIRFFLINN